MLSVKMFTSVNTAWLDIFYKVYQSRHFNDFSNIAFLIEIICKTEWVQINSSFSFKMYALKRGIFQKYGRKKIKWPSSELQRWYESLNRSDLHYSANLADYNPTLLFSSWWVEAIGLLAWAYDRFSVIHILIFSLNYKNNNLNVNVFIQNNYRLLACQGFGEGGFWSRLYIKLKQNRCERSKNIRPLKPFGSICRQTYITQKRNDTNKNHKSRN